MGMRGTIEGIFGRAFGNLVITAADEHTYREGIWNTILTFGKSMALGAGLGGLSGGVLGGGISGISAPFARASANKAIAKLSKAGLSIADIEALTPSQLSSLSAIDDAIVRGSEENARKMFASFQSSLDPEQAARLEGSLFSESSLARAKSSPAAARRHGNLVDDVHGDPLLEGSHLQARAPEPLSEADLLARSRQTVELPDGHTLIETIDGNCYVCTDCFSIPFLRGRYKTAMFHGRVVFKKRLAALAKMAPKDGELPSEKFKAAYKQLDEDMATFEGAYLREYEKAETNPNWPWKHPPTANELRYDDCYEVAMNVLKDKKGGTLVKIEHPTSRELGGVKISGELIEEWQHHYVVMKGDRVFDRITGPEGMSLEKYKLFFTLKDELNFVP